MLVPKCLISAASELFQSVITQVLDAFKDCSLQTFVDGTLGAGGHAAAILR